MVNKGTELSSLDTRINRQPPLWISYRNFGFRSYLVSQSRQTRCTIKAELRYGLKPLFMAASTVCHPHKTIKVRDWIGLITSSNAPDVKDLFFPLCLNQEVPDWTPSLRSIHLNLFLYNHSEHKGIVSIFWQGVAQTEQMSSPCESRLCAFCFISQPASGECTHVCVCSAVSLSFSSRTN